MQSIHEGKAYVFGDNINTDIISPPQYMELSAEEAAQYAMSGVDPEFASKVIPGDIIVAGKNFGSGSSRELAPLALKKLGVGAVVALFFARIFYRNAVNLGLPVVECADTGRIAQDDVISIDFEHGVIVNKTKNEQYACSTLPPHILCLMNAGGLIEHLKQGRSVRH